MRLWIGLALLVLLSVTTPALAEENKPDVQGFLSDCTREDDVFRTGYCMGLIQGTRQVMGANCWTIRRGKAADPGVAADTDGVSLGALVQTFENWARANPQKWHLHESTGVILAIRDTFPCD